ncbi:unnamed protein product, partial [Discosporangium mesarthrocarpum]
GSGEGQATPTVGLAAGVREHGDQNLPPGITVGESGPRARVMWGKHSLRGLGALPQRRRMGWDRGGLERRARCPHDPGEFGGGGSDGGGRGGRNSRGKGSRSECEDGTEWGQYPPLSDGVLNAPEPSWFGGGPGGG